MGLFLKNVIMKMRRAGNSATKNVSIVKEIGCSFGYFRSWINTEKTEATTSVKVIMNRMRYMRSFDDVIPNRVCVISVVDPLL